VAAGPATAPVPATTAGWLGEVRNPTRAGWERQEELHRPRAPPRSAAGALELVPEWYGATSA
jgi:hypothetical protein